ncbi:RNA-splicing factor [Sporothrix eucalyptigena]|uniref:Pre-mRNA-splicing factor CWC24 n=1 Tax=Sporothrix eucalyptigena TaxID=1812306 RepID=A0ABP0B7T2_9PEZI
MTEPQSPPVADGAAAAEVVPIAPVLFKARGRKGKSNMRKRSPTPPPAKDSDSDSDSDRSSDEGRNAIREAKRRRKNGAGVISASTEGPSSRNTNSLVAELEQPLHYTDRSTLLADSDVATKRSHMFDDKSTKKDASTTSASVAPTPGALMGGVAPAKSVGPVKAAANIRTITFTDFSPDVCKDYKQTGFCGFGDSCKFLHAREDYKQGWQLDNEWEAVTKGKKNLGGTIVASADRKKFGDSKNDDDDDEDEAFLRDIPFACVICREGYKNPIVTRCGHYFCEKCALDRYRRDPSCAACGAATTGVFNNAKRLTKLLERKRQRAAKRRQAAIEAGEEVSSAEEGEESD